MLRILTAAIVFLSASALIAQVARSQDALSQDALRPAADNHIDFAHDILPLLKARCAECHTNGTYKAALSLETRAALLDSGTVEPGDSKGSHLIERVASTDADERMPPEGDPLTKQQIALLTNWIDQGAVWPEEISLKEPKYIAPLAPRTPQLPPVVAGREHPIDRIVDAYFAEHKLERPAPADDALFLRRASLDLVGLLPSPEELDAFVADAASDKRSAAVARLLDQRRAYTDHWLTFWNDLLRNDYAGTGYIDGGRGQITGWLYNSLYNNKPYDQFVQELVAPKPESDGFIRGIKWRGRVNSSQTPEIQFSQNISQVFLGINMKCASCHDSFIDDWKLDDAYGLAAITSDRALEIHRCDHPTGETAKAKFFWPELGEIDAAAPRAKRLEQLSKLLTKQENGRFARTIVNRYWERLMGRGVVHPVDMMGNEPWSEDLLDWLAADFVAHNHDLKHLLRRITTSEIYQAQSILLDEEPAAGEFTFRGPLPRRMNAEQYLDSIWQLTAAGPNRPNAGVQLPAPQRQPYLLRASLVVSDPLMRSLGRPNREQVVTTRPADLTTLQALDLSNGEQLYNTLTRGAAHWIKQHPDAAAPQLIEQVFRHALGRTPTAEELETALPLVGDPVQQEGLADLLWALVMLPEYQLIR